MIETTIKSAPPLAPAATAMSERDMFRKEAAKHAFTQKFGELKFFEKIVLSSYTCDFGNIVLGSSKKKSIKIFNVGELPLSISVDPRHFKNAGYTFSLEKGTNKPLYISLSSYIVQRLPPGESIQLQITYQTRKNLKFGKTKCIVPIEIKNGPRYNVIYSLTHKINDFHVD